MTSTLAEAVSRYKKLFQMNVNKKSEGKKQNPLKENNPFEHVYSLYNKDASAQKDFSNFHQKFKNKTYYEQYKVLANIALLLAVLVGGLCVFLACTYFADLINKAVPNMSMSIGIAVVLLLLLEYGLKARIIPMATRAGLDRKRSFAFLLPITLAIIGASIFTSYSGSQKLFYVVGTQTGDVRNVKDGLIADLRAQQKSILADREAYQKRNPKKSASWLGADEMKDLNKQISGIQADKQTEVSELTEQKASNTGHLIYLCLICELLILICYGFREFFEWKSYRECLVLNPELAQKNMIEVTHLSGQFATNDQFQIAAETNQTTPQAQATNPIGFRTSQSDFKTCTARVDDSCVKGDEKTCKDVGTDGNGNSTLIPTHYETTGKTLTYHQVKDRLNKYRGFKQRGERNPDTTQARINYFAFMLSEMEESGTNKIEEILFDKKAWLQK